MRVSEVNELSMRGRLPTMIIPSAIGAPAPSGLTAEQWDKAVEDILRAIYNTAALRVHSKE